MMQFTLNRLEETKNSTHGKLTFEGSAICLILERGLHNANGHLRVPAATYILGRRSFGVSHFDAKFKTVIPEYKGILWIPNGEVPGRENIELHTCNFVWQLLGCIASATSIGKDDNGDFSAVASIDAYKLMYPVISHAIDNGGAQLVIIDPPA